MALNHSLTLTLGYKNKKRPTGPIELDLEAGNLVNNLKLKVEGVSEVAKELRIRIEDERKSLELMTFKNYSNLTLSCKEQNSEMKQAFGD